MNTIRNTAALAACLVAGAACAQAARQPLNLQLPPGDVPAASSTAADRPSNLQRPPGMPAAASTAPSPPARDANGNPTSPPGVYYGDHSGSTADAGQYAAAQRCDDATYNQPQTHGSVSMGVMGGNHVSGNYQAGTFSFTRNLGSCERPAGGVGFSIHVSQSRFHGRGW
ncbi:MAG: hypothetical protein ACREPZ_03145 [Rhodanobacteraceae bacterium]